jgi:signal recognition particle subunit SRP54
VIIDTAGRLAIDEAMMTEVANIKMRMNPQRFFLWWTA